MHEASLFVSRQIQSRTCAKTNWRLGAAPIQAYLHISGCSLFISSHAMLCRIRVSATCQDLLYQLGSACSMLHTCSNKKIHFLQVLRSLMSADYSGAGWSETSCCGSLTCPAESCYIHACLQALVDGKQLLCHGFTALLRQKHTTLHEGYACIRRSINARLKPAPSGHR